MKDSTMIQAAKNLPGIRININADLDFIAFFAVCGIIMWKIIDCNDTFRYHICGKAGEETEKSDE